MNKADFFKKNGWASFPSILTCSEVKDYRRLIENIFLCPPNHRFGDNIFVRTDVMNRWEDLRGLFFRDSIIESCKSILGNEIYLLPEISLMESQYGRWHKDTTSLEMEGYSFHKNTNFSALNIAIYLQNNDPNFAGGLDVVPGSHMLPDSYINFYSQKQPKNRDRLSKAIAFWRKSISSLLNRYHPYRYKRQLLKLRRSELTSLPLVSDDTEVSRFTINSDMGDMVAFDLRTTHKATWPKVPLSSCSDKYLRKYAFFAFVAGNSYTANEYMKYLYAMSKKKDAYTYIPHAKPSPSLLKLGDQYGVKVL